MKKRLRPRVMLSVLALILVGTMLGACSSGTKKASSESSSTSTTVSDINIWLWDNSASRLALYKNFTDKYPQYKTVLTMVQSQDMAQKLQTTMASGSQMPDIAWLEASYRGQLLSLNIWQDLSKAPYNVKKSDLLSWLLPLETAPNGAYVGPEAPSAGGMAYKRSLTKQYFGTDDPDQVAALFTSWDDFISKGAQVKQQSEKYT